MKQKFYHAAQKKIVVGGLYLAEGAVLEVRVVSVSESHVIIEDAVYRWAQNIVPLSNFILKFQRLQGEH